MKKSPFVLFFIVIVMYCSCSGEESAIGLKHSSSSSVIPSIFVSIQGVQNGYESMQNGKFVFTLSEVTNTNVIIYYSIASDSIAKQTDLNPALSSSVTIYAGTLSTNITVFISNDLLVEGTEDLILTLNRTDNIGVGINPASATIKIIDNDSYLATVSLPETLSVTEGSTASLTATMSQALSVDLVAYYIILVSSTLSSSEYVSLPGSFTIPAGSTTTNIGISVHDDLLVEGNENLIVVLYGTDNYGVAINSRASTITVFDNDIGDASIRCRSDAQEGGAQGAFEVSISQPATVDVRINYAIQPDSAGAEDIEPLIGTVVIPAGQVSVVFSVVAIDDNLVEGTERLIINLTGTDNPSVLIHPANSNDDILILDND